jgi:hypothetical protein
MPQNSGRRAQTPEGRLGSITPGGYANRGRGMSASRRKRTNPGLFKGAHYRKCAWLDPFCARIPPVGGELVDRNPKNGLSIPFERYSRDTRQSLRARARRSR